MYNDETSEALLLVDVDIACNSLNREVALRNTLRLYPSFARVLINTYRSPANLFIDGEAILLTEGTTQGDPLAMALYALGLTPLTVYLPQIQ